jgi:anthranilate synthase component 1
MFYRSIVAFDHAKQVVNIVSLDDDSTADAANRNARIRRTLEEPNVPLSPKLNHPQALPTVASNWPRKEFEDAVVKIKELINAGECYQAVLSQRFTRETDASAVAIYRALRALNPSPYMFLLDFGDKQVVGASPEMLVRCQGDGLEYRPIAGTRPRGKTPAEDDALAEEMRRDEKEVAEHLMLVDLGRNDLGRVAEYGSVKVDTLMSVEKYSHVQHLVSALSAKLRPGLDRFDALAACFPAGTVSGAPKVAAINIIRELEPTPRGIYAGAVGYFDYSGNMDTCIAIRTLVLENGVATIQAGAGIVADSVPEREFDETVNKAKVLVKAIEIAEGGGET